MRGAAESVAARPARTPWRGLLDLLARDDGAVLAQPGVRGGQHLGNDLLGLLGLFVAFAFFLGHRRVPCLPEGSLPPWADGRQRAASGAHRLRGDGACRGEVGGWGRECKGERRRARGPRKQSGGLFSATNARVRLRGLGVGWVSNAPLCAGSSGVEPHLTLADGVRNAGGLLPHALAIS